MNSMKITKMFALVSILLSVSGTVSAAELVRLATTTSTYHSGLLDFLLPEFKKDTGYDVQVLAAGTGKALKMGENGDVDLVMTHAPNAEAKFVDKGYGVLPRGLMYNDFVLVGPVSDPAKVKGIKDVTAALAKVAETDRHFVSRGDDSGTHKKELLLWQAASVKPEFSAYKAVGQGMGPTLTMANEIQGYTLTDRGTWLAYQSKLELGVLVEGDKRLFNPYQVILINPSRYPDLNYQGAKELSDWLVNPKAQAMINDFRVNGQQLFVADAG
ncbi:substrate-binding domain-containing protein [Enterovibrio makurazakiensis]|uniref:substrate-binding domain-containing protein n=1 Tax=Enterovibrio makurazakiensis TaxID=2910232 RepID=UPI003D19363D